MDRRLERAQLALDEALDWLPDSITLRTQAGLVYFYAGCYDRAIRHLEQLVTLEPGAAFARYVLAAAQLFAGDVLTARERLRGIVECDLRPPDDCDFNAAQHALGALIFLQARYGGHDEAVRLFHQFGSYFAGEHISPVALAVALAGFGRHIEVGQQLREARRTGDPGLIFLPHEPYFNHMRGDPQFEKTCEDVLSRKPILEDPQFKT
jgi:tetratricopeptide (TPR) repeat protein